MQSGALQPSIIYPLSKGRLFAILFDANYTELETFIAQYVEQKQHNPQIEDFFNIQIKDDHSAFAIATIKNNVRLMQLLISAGANPNLQFANGIAAIHLAVIKKNRQALEYLILIEVDLNLKCLCEDKTAVMYAAHVDNDEAIRLLANAQANVDITFGNNVTATYIAVVNNMLKALQALIDARADLSIATETGHAPVHIAAQKNHYEALEKLINANADINACTKLNFTALFLAVNDEHVESVRIILACTRTNLNYQCTDEQRTAIFHAVCVVNPVIFELLLAHHADPYIPAFLNTIECSLRRLAKTKKRNSNTIEINRIITIINTIPKFPTYENGVSFIYHSVNEPGVEQQSETLSVAEATQLSFNSRMIAPGFLFNDIQLGQFERIYNMMNTGLSLTSSISVSSRTRRESFCSYDSNDTTDSTHVKSKSLGKGSYGSVSLMKSSSYRVNNLAVKEFPPTSLKYSDEFDEEYISTIVSEHYPAIAREAYVNYVIHGVGAVYCDQKPIAYEIKDENNTRIKVLTAYPRSYLAMKFFDGIPLLNYKITSGKQYLEIFKGLLKKLQIFHKKFIHGDIKSNNIIVHNNSVNLVDFSLSRPAGQFLYVKSLNPVCKPPEFKDKVYIKVAANQDIYCVGQVFQEFYSEKLFSKEVAVKVKELYTKMLGENPDNRSTIESSIEMITSLQNAIAREEYLESIFSWDVRFISEFEKVKAEDQLSFLKDLDVTAIRKLFQDCNKFLSLYEKVHAQNQVDFLKLMGVGHLLSLIEDFYSDFRSKQLPNLLSQVQVTFGKSALEIMITKFFKRYFTNSTFRAYDLNTYITNSNKTVSIDFTNTVLKNIISNFMKNNNDIKSSLEFCDNFKSSSNVYKQLLLIVNEAYREGRAADPRNYFTLFGWYSKNDKVQASLALKNSFQAGRPDNNVFDLGALNQGNLGQIAQRLKRCS